MSEFHGVNLCVRAGETALLSGLNLDLRAGECVALVGESGSGKSLTALTLMGLLPPKLSARWDSVRDELPRKAMVFQEPMSALNPTMRVGRQVAEAAEAALGLRRAEATARALEELREIFGDALVPAPAFGRTAPASYARVGIGKGPGASDLRRADDGA